MKIALTREVSPRIADCELTHIPRQGIDFGLVQAQHAAYEACLGRLGYAVRRLPGGGDMPDSVFIEDIAFVLPEVALVTRPGAVSRRVEIPQVAAALAAYRELLFVESPATLDGGDVLRIGREIWVGISGRSNLQALEQMQRHLGPAGYRVHGVEVQGCLHLKSAITQVAGDMLLANPAWVDPTIFKGSRVIEVDPTEPHAANALMLDEVVVYPLAYEKTWGRLEQAGVRLLGVDVSELAKAEGGVTCCSLIFDR